MKQNSVPRLDSVNKFKTLDWLTSWMHITLAYRILRPA